MVPHVPIIPSLSIVCNIVLMTNLNLLTWIRFLIWMVIGECRVRTRPVTVGDEIVTNKIITVSQGF